MITTSGFSAQPANVGSSRQETNRRAVFNFDTKTVKSVDYISLKSVRSFYGLTGEKMEGKALTLNSRKLRLVFRKDSQEVSMNGLKFVYSFPVIEENGIFYISRIDFIKLLDPVLRPKLIRNAENFDTIILDPGHGGSQAGAVANGHREADLNLKLATQVKQQLQAKGFRNVVLTRTADTTMSLQERVDFANKYKNAIFVSLHFNSGRSSASGIETFTLTPAGTSSTYRAPKFTSDDPGLSGNQQDTLNIALATAIQGSVKGQTRAEDRGVKRARYSVLNTVKHPAVLFEGGFLTNTQEAILLRTDAYVERIAQGIAGGIERYRRVVLTR